jgi:hypothetical protein
MSDFEEFDPPLIRVPSIIERYQPDEDEDVILSPNRFWKTRGTYTSSEDVVLEVRAVGDEIFYQETLPAGQRIVLYDVRPSRKVINKTVGMMFF